VRFYVAVTLSPAQHLWSDPARHWQNALEPVTRNPLSGIDPLTYQIWLMVVAKVFNGSMRAMGPYAGLLSVLTPWLWYRFLRELLPTKLLALIGYGLFCWLPSWIGIFSYFMTETLVLPLLSASLWFTWRCLRKGTLESFVWATMFWIAALMTKQSLVPIAVIAVSWLWISQTDRRRRAVIAILMALGVLIPAGLRVQSIIGVWAPLGYSKLNQIYMDSGNASMEVRFTSNGQELRVQTFLSPSIHTQPLAPFSQWESQRDGTCRFIIDVANGRRDWERVLEEQQPSLAARIEHQWENVIFLLWATSWPDNNPSYLCDRVANACRWIWAPLLIIVFIGDGIILWRFKKWNLLPVLTIFGWLILCSAPVGVGEGRYRKPFEGLLIANVLWLTAAAKMHQDEWLQIAESTHHVGGVLL
jgi:hypothetical protein